MNGKKIVLRQRFIGNEGENQFLTHVDGGCPVRMISSAATAPWQFSDLLSSCATCEDLYAALAETSVYFRNTFAENTSLQEIYGYSSIYPCEVKLMFDPEDPGLQQAKLVLITFLGTLDTGEVKLVRMGFWRSEDNSTWTSQMNQKNLLGV